jgi:hypothetical protein
MFSLENVVLPNFLENKLIFLKSYGIEFGGFVENIAGDFFTPVWLIIGFILVLFFKNSMEKIKEFKVNYKKAFFIAFLIYYTLVSMITVKSEFLYFNF